MEPGPVPFKDDRPVARITRLESRELVAAELVQQSSNELGLWSYRSDDSWERWAPGPVATRAH